MIQLNLSISLGCIKVNKLNMEKSILTIGLSVLLCSVGFSQTAQKATESNSQNTTQHPREVKLKKPVNVQKPATTISIDSKTMRRAEARKEEAKKEEVEK